ncbi:hypothetical protein CR51_36040 [Caballeronia megalochromosomata]|nr:hypothetical protein CR51_36040 [Caballeronia megalochromosomata]
MLPSKSDGTWLSTQAIRARLLENGHEQMSAKYVLRQMRQLEEAFKVISMEEPGKRPIYWQRALGAGAGYKSAEHMPASEAVAFSLLERLTKVKLPKTILGDVDGLFDAARQRLKVAHDGGQLHKKWLDKIETVEALFPLVRPSIDDDVFNAIKDATFQERIVRVRYHSAKTKREKTKPEWKRVAPLALVESAGLMYVVVQEMDFPPDPAKGKLEWLRPALRLDRIAEVELTKERFNYPAEFKLGEYVKTKKAFEFLVEGEAFRLRLAFSNYAGEHLLESHISEDQAPPEWDDKKRLILTATVVNSLKFRWWLRSFGPDVEILEPQWLREQVAADARQVAQQYAAC